MSIFGRRPSRVGDIICYGYYADDGVYSIDLVKGYDVAGNVAGEDRDPSNNDWQVNIR